MVRDKKVKCAAILTAVLSVVAFSCGLDLGLCRGGDWIYRLMYSFCHASFFHLAANLFCFLCLVFGCRTPMSDLIVAFAIATAVPDMVLFSVPTLGLSAVCNVLSGITSFRFRQSVHFYFIVAAYLCAGFFFCNVNAAVHLYAFFIGAAYGILTAPIIARHD